MKGFKKIAPVEQFDSNITNRAVKNLSFLHI